MAAEDYFDLYGEPDDWGSRHDKECRFCGAAGLHWEETEHGWRLANPSGRLHKCNPKRLTKSTDFAA